MSEASYRAAVAAEQAAGRISAEQAASMLGIEPGAASTAQTDPVAAHLEQYGTPAAKATDFELPPGAFEGLSDKDAMAASNQFREVMTAAKLSKANGGFLAKVITEHDAVWHAMDDTAKELYNRESLVKLRAMWKDDFAENLVKQLIDEIGRKHPLMHDLMEMSGAGSNVAVLVKLAEHARILDQRIR